MVLEDPETMRWRTANEGEESRMPPTGGSVVVTDKAEGWSRGWASAKMSVSNDCRVAETFDLGRFRREPGDWRNVEARDGMFGILRTG